MTDFKHYLRKIDFPNVVLDALHHIQKLWVYESSAQQLMKEIAEEFVFFEVDRRGVRRQKLSPVKELQVLDKLCFFFSSHGSEQKTTTFLFLFPPASNVIFSRLPFLARLVSMAIAVSSGSVLNFVGMWMQLSGCMSEASLHVASTVVEDYFKIITCKNALKELPNIAPLFCAGFITAITTFFSSSPPSHHIIETVLDWIKSSPTICFAPLKMALPFSGTYHGPQTPLPGLLLWTVLVPLYGTDKQSTSNGGTLENGEVEADIFSHLHLVLLQSLLKAAQMKDIPRLEVFTRDQIIVIIERLQQQTNCSVESMQIALNRFAQVLQVSLATRFLRSSRENLNLFFEKCRALPDNRLMNIIMKKWTAVLQSGDA